ncbi:MAG: DUF115 domain-containing protein [Acidobacteriota bacterium]|jgi:hypothetical protein|nr:DUF115 domain-containing protein [Acidobacteriota bacterium]
MKYLEANLKSLSRKQPDLAALLRTIDRSHIKTFPSADGAPTAAIEHDGKTVELHSRYNPSREARQAIKKENYDGTDYFIFLGFGLGYALDAAIEKYGGPDRHYFVVEADPGILRAALEARDFTFMFAAHDIYFAWPSSGSELAEQWRQRFNLALARKSAYVTHAPALKLDPGHYKAAVETLQGQIYQTLADRSTLMEKTQIYLDNFIQNLPTVAAAPGINIFAGKFTDTPAVIVSAGPSLDKNIHELRDKKDHALIIATDTTLKPLLAAGVEPHFVMTGDPAYVNYLHLKGAVTHEALLVMEATAHPQSPEGFEERTLACLYENSVLHSLSELPGDKGVLRAWGSVATMALDFAMFAGCDPVIFIGQDLAYTGGRLYCSNVWFEDVWFKDVKTQEEREKRLADLRTANNPQVLTDIFGRPVETTRALIAYRDWIVRIIGNHPEKRFINATEGGILGGAVELLSLRETLERDCGRNLNLVSRVGEIYAAARRETVPDLEKNLAPFLKERDSLQNAVRDGINAAAKSPNWNPSKYIERLDKIQSRISVNRRLAPLVDSFNQVGNTIFQQRMHIMSTQPPDNLPAAIQTTYADYFTSAETAVKKISDALGRLTAASG